MCPLDKVFVEGRQAVLRASLRRPTSVAAAAPNRISIGGAGTSVPPELLEVEPPEVEELDELEDELDVLDEELVEPPEEPDEDEEPDDELDEEPLLDDPLDE